MPINRSEIEPIDGGEIKQIILNHLSQLLNRDSTLTTDIAYPGFKCRITVDLSFIRSTTAPTLVWGDVQRGNLSEGEGLELVTEHGVDEYETDAPNAARMDHDLPIPMMIQQPDGRTRRVKAHVGRKA